MAGKDLKEAAEKMAKRKDILRRPVPMLPDDPENLHLSKAEFLAKRRNQRDEAVAVEKFKQDFRANKIQEDSSGGQEKEEVKEEVLEEPKKKKRSKKIVD